MESTLMDETLVQVVKEAIRRQRYRSAFGCFVARREEVKNKTTDGHQRSTFVPEAVVVGSPELEIFSPHPLRGWPCCTPCRAEYCRLRPPATRTDGYTLGNYTLSPNRSH